MSLLAVDALDVRFDTPDGEVHAVHGLSFEVAAGETLGIVGESGSGKSQTMLGLLGLLADNGRVTGSARLDGTELVGLSDAALRRIRGRDVSMIFQDPMTSLNPYLTVHDQMVQVLRHHEGLGRREARARCVQMLDAVRIPEAASRLDRYPHEFSGGMRQRVMIASALLCRPRLLIADEPTTALDVTVQAQILELMKDIRRDFGTAIILITHDLGVVAGTCDRVLVMHRGECRETGPVDDIFARPRHPYTRALLDAVPRLDQPGARPLGDVRDGAPVIEVEDLQVHFQVPAPTWFGRARTLKAVDGVSLTVRPGETLGVVGESGCGKSTLARAILRLVPATAGRVALLGRDISDLDRRAMRPHRRDLQVVFQDPLASLNPRMTVGDIVTEPLWTHARHLSRAERRKRVLAVLERVGLTDAHANRYPHEFSGGQCQRIGIARALVLEPDVVICDEPVSALDVSIQAQIVRLLMDLQAELGLSLIFIAHDLAVVRHISHRIMVMYLGRAVEVADRDTLCERPVHPYTQALIGSVPVPDPAVERARTGRVLFGDLPSPLSPPSGCAFRTRCPHAVAGCAQEVPKLRRFDARLAACHELERLNPPSGSA